MMDEWDNGGDCGTAHTEVRPPMSSSAVQNLEFCPAVSLL